MRQVRRLLVTGGAGFMGSHFIRHLLTQDVERVVNLDLLTYASSSIEIKDERYRFVRGDICDASLVHEIVAEEEIDTIVHFAAETHVDRSIQDPRPFLEANVIGTFQLLQVVRQLPHLHFHHISTDEVFGSIEEGAAHEKTHYNPSSPYSAAKAASDHFVSAFHRTYGISCTLSHSSNNFGPCQYPEKLMPLTLTRALQMQEIPIYGSGEQCRDWLYVDDHSRAVWNIVTKGKSGESYNVCTGRETSNLEVVTELLKALAREMDFPVGHYLKLITHVRDRPGHDFRYAMDPRKIHEELGWKPEISFQEGIERTVKWYTNQLCSTAKK